MSYRSINPFYSDPVANFDEHTDGQLDPAISTIMACFENWRRRIFAESEADPENRASG